MSEIKPALTPEEWAEVMALDASSLYHPRGHAKLDHAGPEFSEHACAAWDLHGQPFGFTWEDVDALRDAAGSPANDDICTPGCRHCLADVAHRVLLRSLADRIAALLPPRE